MNELGTVKHDFNSKVIDSYKRCQARQKSKGRQPKEDHRKVVPFSASPKWGKCL